MWAQAASFAVTAERAIRSASAWLGTVVSTIHVTLSSIESGFGLEGGDVMRVFAIVVIFALPVLDILLTREFAHATGVSIWWWLALGSVSGVLVLRHERAYFKARLNSALMSAAAHESNPWRSVLDSGRKIVAGLLLLLPGVMSDVFALALMLIPINMAAKLTPVWAASLGGGTPSRGPRTVEGSFRRVE
jgi:UPF0716 protein FxsA